MPRGPSRWAALAGPPSPAESLAATGCLASAAVWAAAVSPAIVVIVPLVSTLRTRLLPLSEM